MKKKNPGKLIIMFSLALTLLLLIGCKSSDSQSGIPGAESGESEMNNESESGSEDPSGANADQDNGSGTELDPLVISRQEWEISPHANTYVVDDQNQNNTCARCHAPTNWMPTLDDIPESCQACKFELEAPPPFISKNEWTGITCLYCHEEDKKGVVQPEVMWLEIPALEEYASVENYTELCLKCHETTNVPDHGEVKIGGDHKGMSCTDCHPPHSAKATCDSTDCHPADPAADPIQGHDDVHQNVSCAACHDSAGWDVGIDEETGVWITYSQWTQELIIAEGDSIIDSGMVSFASHDISKAVNCERCHFVDNEWGLTADVETP
jgi:hypothetical protein